MKTQLNQTLTSKQLLSLTMTFYFLSFLTESNGILISGGFSVLGLFCLAMFLIALVRDARKKTEKLAQDIFLILIGYGFLLGIIYDVIK